MSVTPGSAREVVAGPRAGVASATAIGTTPGAAAGSACVDAVPAPRAVKVALRGEMTPKLQPQWLTDVVANVVHAQRGQAKAIALALGTTENRVRDAADVNGAAPLKAWWIPAIVAETGSYAILDAIEAKCGRVAFALPVISNPAHIDLLTHTADVVREFGEALAKLSTSLVDGVLTTDERAQVQHEIYDVQQALAQLSILVANTEAV